MIKGDGIGDGQVGANHLTPGLSQQVQKIVTHTHNGGDSVQLNSTSLIYPQWISYTPQINQGASVNIAKTVSYAKYYLLGNVVNVQMRLDITGAGSAGSTIVFTLPFTPAYSYYNSIGGGYYYDSGTASYMCDVEGNNNGNYAQMSAASVTATGASIGSNPNLAVANGDAISVHLSYEMA